MRKKIKFIIQTFIIFFIVTFLVFLLFPKMPTYYITITSSVVTMILQLYNTNKNDRITKKTLLMGDYDATEYVNRDEEQKVLTELEHGNHRIIYITGCSGIGKTLFLYKILNEINTENKIHGFKAVYFYIDFNYGPDDSFCSQLNIPKGSNIDSIVESIKDACNEKKTIILIDNSQDIQTVIDEFILKLKNKDVNFRFVVASKNTKNPKAFFIQLREFKKNDIITLAKKINIKIKDHQVSEIQRVTYGLPVFVTFLIKDIADNAIDIKLTDSYRIQDYIISKTRTLNEYKSYNTVLECLLLISFYAVYDNKLNKNEGKSLFQEISDRNLKCLQEHSFIFYDNNVIKIDQSIAQIIREEFEDKRFMLYKKIYEQFNKKNDCKRKYFFLLLTQEIIEKNDIKAFLFQMLTSKNYQYLVKLFDKTNTNLNITICNDDEFFQVYIYCYLSSLVELGEYTIAKNYIESDDFNDLLLINPINLDLAFKVEYLISDLYHLMCEYDRSLEQIDIMKGKYQNNTYQAKLLWLQGHIYRHQGNLSAALDNFNGILYGDYSVNIEKIIVKSMYSIISIHMFFMTKSFSFEDKFEELDNYLLTLNDKTKYESSINRHKAIYKKRIMNRHDDSLILLSETIKKIEAKPERILYDYYFEIAEVYRILAQNEKDEYYKKAEENYQKAIDFSSAMNDFNLFENCKLGFVLLKIKNSSISREDIKNEINKLTSKFTKDRFLNYTNFQFVKTYYQDQDMNKMIQWFEINHWNYHIQFLKSKKSVADFELTVM